MTTGPGDYGYRTAHGEDLIKKLAGRDFGDGILLPTVMLKHDEAKFLDDKTVAEVAITLETPIYAVENVLDLMNRCCQD